MNFEGRIALFIKFPTLHLPDERDQPVLCAVLWSCRQLIFRLYPKFRRILRDRPMSLRRQDEPTKDEFSNMGLD